MKSILANSNRFIDWGKNQNIDHLRNFLVAEPTRPLICIGSGGSFSICRLIAILLSSKGAIGQAITPYQAFNLPDDVILLSQIGIARA